MEKLNFNDVLTIVSDYVANPDSAEHKEAYQKLIGKLVIKSYLPMDTKSSMLDGVIFDIRVGEAVGVDFSIGIELSKLFNGLLAYTNIDLSTITAGLKIGVVYDILHLSGFVGEILKYCRDDYERFCHMVDSMISFENLKQLLEELGDFDSSKVDALIAAYGEFSLEKNAETIKNMAEILRSTDTMTTKVRDAIDEGAYEVALQGENDKKANET